MRIAVDAMGGDHAPHEIVKGAVEAARRLTGIERLYLVGREEAVRAELAKHGKIPPVIEVRNAGEVIAMNEAPALAVRRKKDASISRAIDLVRDGEADAVVSAGNTGALVASATLKLRTLEGVERPAIAVVMPTRLKPFVLIDVGANLDCPPLQLLQFAVMGQIYSREILGQANPVVGLLSIGGEDNKGNELTRETFQLLKATSLNFRGNVEGHGLFDGDIDVVVCDGFTGNVVLKSSESVAKVIGQWMKEEFKRNPVRILGALLLRGAFKAMKQKMDPDVYGGAPLLGVNGVCIKAHGSSKAKAVFHAVRVAGESIGHHVTHHIVDEIRKLNKA
jgi:glycerol-3-phosphate acyltransferase PlsX